MPIYLFVFLVVSGLGLSAQAQQPPQDSSAAPARKVYTITQEIPHFPGSMDKLGKYLRENLHYPESARKARTEGKVFISFIVNEKGGIEEVRALKSLDPALDAEAVRLVQTMPAWVPGKVNGEAVACRFNLPINFEL